MAEVSAPIAVALRGITKRFPGVLANDRVNLDVRQGEIHALLGENGAGKSTLMSALCGLYQPDEGEICLSDDKGQLHAAAIHSPRAAIAAGIGMVHQHFKLVASQTVAENVILGLDGIPFRLDMGQVEERINRLGQQYHLPVDPNAYIWQLSVGEQQRVEILKQLYRGADILILDEPTAVLTPQESEELGHVLRGMVAEGKAIIFISHKLDEVIAFADRVTVLRDGRNVATLEVKNTNKAELARLMVGREVLFRVEKEPLKAGDTALALQGVTALNDKGLKALKNVSLTICRGEILGIAGVAGNGQRALTEVVTGLRSSISGKVLLRGQDLTNQSSRRFIQAGVSHVPSDRLGMGLAGNLPVSDNLIMKAYRQMPLASGPFLRGGAIISFANKLIQTFQVSTPSSATPARMLSGGNQQKAILAREITAGKQRFGDGAVLLVAAYPTRGLDVGAIEAVRQMILTQRRDGTAILLISEDLDELMAISDRIAVLHGGEIMGIVDAAAATIEELGLMMAGERRQ
ncbi:MAG: ABC transporter ATP-binding protein [Chloroflexi bacterium]|nr:ABC transporter ATP-binding protein [Chloroflexota bacterium]MBP8055951.1 ABC transporter ATP-binding protein [Chloroflexota bacterium]